MGMQLKDKVAIVTGAGQGIGRAIALDLASNGATVFVTDLDYKSAQKKYQLLKDNQVYKKETTFWLNNFQKYN